MHQFQENLPELKGFSQHYDEAIFPALAEREIRRKAALKKIVMLSLLIAAASTAIAIFAWLKTQQKDLFVFAAFGAFVAIGAMATFMLKSIKSETKNDLVEGICGFMGWRFFETPTDTPDLQLLIENGLLPKKFDRSSFEDQMTGSVHGVDFESVECLMERKERDRNGGTKWVKVFRGMIMVMDFHRDFLGKTVVLRDKGIFNKKKRGDMKRVGLVDPVFEKIFEAYGTDQVEARYLLTPDFMQKLVDLETSVDGKKIRFGFLNDLLLIVVETPNRFEAGSMLKSLTDTTRTQNILNEVTAVYGVVDGLMKPQSVPDSFKT